MRLRSDKWIAGGQEQGISSPCLAPEVSAPSKAWQIPLTAAGRRGGIATVE